MEYTKKRLLGYASLAAVLAMTAFASTLPEGDASATTSSGASVTYSVTVINPLHIEVEGGNGDNPTIIVTPDDSGVTPEDNVVDHIDYTVVDKDGNVVIGPVDVDVPPDGTEIELPFIDEELPPGDYTVIINGHNKDDELVFTREISLAYTAPIYVPDTGTLTIGSLQIARANYWAVGILVALIAGGVAFGLHRRARK